MTGSVDDWQQDQLIMALVAQRHAWHRDLLCYKGTYEILGSSIVALGVGHVDLGGLFFSSWRWHTSNLKLGNLPM
eukprot:3234672-Amphidinium_carterae.1